MTSGVPSELSLALADRETALRGRAVGRVLDLATTSFDEVTGRYDTILSVVRTPAEPDLGRFLGRIRDHLASDGWAYFLEPTVRTGPLGRALGISGRLGRPLTGLHLDRDIPAAIRGAGLFVADLHRFEIASVAAPFRPFVEAWARFPSPRTGDGLSPPRS